MARKFEFVKDFTGPALAKKLIDKYEYFKKEPTVQSVLGTHYAVTSIGDRIEYSALIEYETTDY